MSVGRKLYILQQHSWTADEAIHDAKVRTLS